MRKSLMGNTPTLRGFTTISYWADDLEAARRWYAELLGIEPYFERPGYCEFRVGDHQDELGLLERRDAPGGSATGLAGVVMYLTDDDCEDDQAQMLSVLVK